MNEEHITDELMTMKPYRPVGLAPRKKQSKVKHFIKSAALIGGLTAASMYFGAKNSETVKGYVSSGVQKVDAAFDSIQGFFSGAVKRGLDVEDTLDAKVDPDAADKREIMEFVKKANREGMNLDAFKPYLKPEAAKKLELLKSMYKDQQTYGGK